MASPPSKPTMNAKVRKDLKEVVGSFHATFNEAQTPYYAFCIHINGNEIAHGMWLNNAQYISPDEWDYVWSRATGTCSRPHGTTRNQVWNAASPQTNSTVG